MSTLTEEVQADGTKKAPLFCREGIRDEEDSELQEVVYSESYDHTFPDPQGRYVVTIFAFHLDDFSPLVRSWFEDGPHSNIKGFDRRILDTKRRINVAPAHPLYLQVKAAYEAQEAHSDSIFEAAKKWNEAVSKEGAACAPHQFTAATPKEGA
ncbi:hypothetical protein XF_1654 [Xylella fastidiosa 9a5c]|uniref:Uncharacterized protein n=1 Tax=Xylella fastidiosa (strain 9a5c) TaxID=160492 RepID=Q9PCV1_XYLFA|nr:hypothetical protein [Xylella fastidiosa]AAF84463.1 hypothetical protein XF_1654 [Xylella fastidiosa 9a5c]